MRNIKFRAWDGDNQKMQYDFLISTHGSIHCSNMLGGFDWEDWELMQFTGLKDIEGKDIFEKDIVQWIDSDGDGDERIDIVKYKPCLFYLCNSQHSVFSYSGKKMELKIIGNTYADPKLKEK